MKLTRVATILAVVTTSPLAFADRLQAVVDPSVTSIVFDNGTNTRAVAGDNDDGSFLAIERLRNGRITDQTWVGELPIGSSMVPVTEFKNLRITSLVQSTLTFEAAPRMKGAKRTIQCTAQLVFGRGKVEIRGTACTQGNQPWSFDAPVAAPPPPPPAPVEPPQASLADIKAATRACNEAFAFASEQKKCLDMTIDTLQSTNKFASSAVRVVGACAQGFAFSSSRTWCMETMSRATREPVELIRYCTEQNTFESEQKACLAKFSKSL